MLRRSATEFQRSAERLPLLRGQTGELAGQLDHVCGKCAGICAASGVRCGFPLRIVGEFESQRAHCKIIREFALFRFVVHLHFQRLTVDLTVEGSVAAAKPRQKFPLFLSKTGQWRKDIWDPKLKKSTAYYFGSAADDPTGSKALADWLKREPAIRDGLDKLRVAPVTGSVTVTQLVSLFIAAKRAAVASHDRSPLTLRDYLRELAWFGGVVGEQAEVSALKPQHFSEVNRRLIQGDGKRGQQGRHSRARIIRYIRALFNWGHKNGHCTLPSFGTDFCPPATNKDAMRQVASRSGKAWNGDRIATGCGN